MPGQNVVAMMQLCDFIDMLSSEWTATEREKLLKLMNTLKEQPEGATIIKIVEWTRNRAGTSHTFCPGFIRRPLGQRQERLPLSL